MSKKHTGPGKGSEPRPMSIPLDAFGQNFDSIFRSKKNVVGKVALKDVKKP